MSDLIASSLTVSFGARPLFSDVSVTVDPGDRIALVGPNGAGKTTLLRVLAGTFSQTAGEVRIPDHLHLALHDQRPERSPTPLKQWVSPERIVSLERELRRLEVEMADGDPAKLTEWEQVRGRYDQLGGEAWHTTVDSVLRGLGFNAGQFDQPLDTLSGGELTRASLARALASGPDILLLDEPTNHLDIDTIEWLQDHLESIPGGVVLVSHDRWFIEATCNSVIEIAHGRARRFKGSFVEYRAQQALEAVTHQREVEKWAEEVSRLQRFVDRFGAGTRARQAQSRAKVLDRLREDVPAYADMRTRKGIGFSLPKIEQPGRTVFDIRGMSLGFGDAGEEGERTLLEPCDLVVERGEKIALIGPNGSGKSTLLHAIAAEAIPLMKQTEAYRGGEVRVGYGAKVRLLAQHDSELVDTQSMLGNMNLAGPGVGRTQAQNLLGLFGFTGDDSEKLVGMLSGGERRRLMMAMSLTGADNVVLFDEPTNHLDIESREALEAALAEWNGTLILISHDRALVEGVATRTVVLHEQTLKTAVGGYEQARRMLAGEPEPPTEAELAAARQAEARRAQQEASRGVGRQRQKQGRGAAAPSMTKTDGGEVGGAGSGGGGGGGRKVSRKGAKNADGSSSPKKKVRRPATIEGEIERLDGELAAVNERMLDPDVYTDPAKSAECLELHTRLDRDIKARWAELERSLEVYG